MNRSRSKPRAFTIIELIVVLLILGVAVAIIAPAFQTVKGREEVREAASTFAADLRLARQTAMTKGVTTGVIVTSPQSYEVRSGEGDNPRLIKYVDLSKDFPAAKIFIGWWDTDTETHFTDPVPNSNEVAMTRWSGSRQDFAYIFPPTGSVKTNNLPNYDGAYHIVFCTAYVSHETGAASAGALAEKPEGWILCALRETGAASQNLAMENVARYQKLDKIWGPIYTVVLTGSGETSLENEVPRIRNVLINPADRSGIIERHVIGAFRPPNFAPVTGGVGIVANYDAKRNALPPTPTIPMTLRANISCTGGPAHPSPAGPRISQTDSRGEQAGQPRGAPPRSARGTTYPAW
jgi:prepilin-type N-terminal cleavage/methylation domain-containing protein